MLIGHTRTRHYLIQRQLPKATRICVRPTRRCIPIGHMRTRRRGTMRVAANYGVATGTCPFFIGIIHRALHEGAFDILVQPQRRLAE